MLTVDRVAGVALALFALVVLWQSRTLPLGSFGNPGPAYMPVMLATLLLVGGIGIAVLDEGTARVSTLGFRGEWRHTVAIFAACAFCALALERIGYRPTVLVTLLFLLAVVERKPMAASVAFAVVFAAGTFFLFDTLLRVPLPRGPLGL